MTGPPKTEVAGSAVVVAEFEAFVRSTHGRLLAHARRRLYYIDDALAEDMVQTMYLRLWHVWLTKGHIASKVNSYSYRVLDNCIRDFWRVKNNWPIAHDATAPSEAVDAADDAVIVRNVVLDAVNTLPARIREVIELNIFEDLPMADVAQRMGITVKVARNYKTAALKEIRERLSADFAERARSAR